MAGIAAAAIVPAAEPTRDELLAIAERVRSAFPHPVDEAELVLIDVDPRHLHAFWTVPFAEAERVLARINGEAASAPMVLRVCPVDIDGEAVADPFDIEVLGLHGQFYVDVWDTPRHYRATLGYRLADGTLVALAASDVAELPAPGPADDRTWREMALPPPSMPVSMAAGPAPVVPAAAGVVAEAVTRRQPADLPRAEHAAAASPGDALHARIAALSPSAVAEAAGPPAAAALPAPTAEGAVEGPTSYFPVLPAASTVSPVPLPHTADQPPREEHTFPGEQAVADQTRGPLSFPMPPFAHEDHRADSGTGSARSDRPFWEMPAEGPPAQPAHEDWPPAERAREDGPPAERAREDGPTDQPAPPGEQQAPAGEDAPRPTAGEEGPPPLPLPLENVLSLSSFVLGRDPVELEVNAELHVFGRVKPGSRLQLFGREVRIRPDGTFSVHRPLGSGAAIMPVVMTEDDEARAAEERRDEPPGDSG